jgi:hypothetical protein
MADLGDIDGGAAKKAKPFSPFDTSKLAEVGGGFWAADKAMEEALGTRRKFPEFEQSAVDRLAEATKSRFTGIDSAVDKIRDALGTNAFRGIILDDETLSGVSSISKQLEQVNKGVADALAPHVEEYNRATAHLRDVFGQNSISDEVTRMINGPSVSREVADYLADLERPLHQPSVLNRMPPLPELPPNPIFETNEHLERVVEKVDALLDVQAKQAEMIDALLQAQIAGTAAQDRALSRSHRVAVISALLAFIAILATVAG